MNEEITYDYTDYIGSVDLDNDHILIRFDQRTRPLLRPCSYNTREGRFELSVTQDD